MAWGRLWSFNPITPPLYCVQVTFLKSSYSALQMQLPDKS